MKHIKVTTSLEAAVRIRETVRQSGLQVAAKAEPGGDDACEFSFYTRDEDALALILLVKHTAYAGDLGNRKITIYDADLPAQSQQNIN